MEFFPAPFRAPLRAFAALVFPWRGQKVLICNIEDRGWCIPSGRVEPGETSIEAAAREAREEGGAFLEEILYIGCYRITEKSEVRWADVFAARVVDLEPLSDEFESLGRKFADLEELPRTYHLWNHLTKRVFEHSERTLNRHERAIGLID